MTLFDSVSRLIWGKWTPPLLFSDKFRSGIQDSKIHSPGLRQTSWLRHFSGDSFVNSGFQELQWLGNRDAGLSQKACAAFSTQRTYNCTILSIRSLISQIDRPRICLAYKMPICSSHLTLRSHATCAQTKLPTGRCHGHGAVSHGVWYRSMFLYNTCFYPNLLVCVLISHLLFSLS